MEAVRQVLFPPFLLDLDNEQLWRGNELLRLRPKSFAVLKHLIAHAGRLVTREELRRAIWPTTCVGEGLLRDYVHELRTVLADDAAEPRLIQTMARRGYRFIAPVTTRQGSPQFPVVAAKETGTASFAPDNAYRSSTAAVVGRDAEIEQLHQWLKQTVSGERQLVFVTGEPGIGKTVTVEAFLRRAATEERFWIMRGQCIEHYSASEAYLPVLEALERLCCTPDGEHVSAILHQHAPLWLAQLPSVVEVNEREILQRQVMNATQERMLREIVRALEELTVRQPLVLWLEDLHGSDTATLDLLAFLARRRELARLLVIGTYRPLAVRTSEHPLYAIQQELQVRGQCHELALDPLSQSAVEEYLTFRLGGESSQPQNAQRPARSAFLDSGRGSPLVQEGSEEEPVRDLARAIHQRTDGNPLFMVSVVEMILRQGDQDRAIEDVSRNIPDNLRHFIEQQVAHLKPAEQQLLEVASVGGVEYSAAALAAGLGEQTEEVEKHCAGFARRGHFLGATGVEEWPDGTVAARFRFMHALYQEVLYERVTAARRVSLHRSMGDRLERGYGPRASERAAELAMHFERGREYGRAVQYLHVAGETAMRRHAYRQAESFLSRGVTLLQRLPDTPEHRQTELALHVLMGSLLSMTRGYADPAVEGVYKRARELCELVGETPQLFPVLRGLWLFSFVRAEHEGAYELAEQLLQLAQNADDPALLVEAHQALGVTLHFLGEFTLAQEHLEKGSALYDPQQHQVLAYAHDPAVVCLGMGAWVLSLRGYPDQAVARVEEAVALARRLSHPPSLAVALVSRALVAQHCHRQESRVQQWVEEAVAFSTAQGFPYVSAGGLILHGALRTDQGQRAGGIAEMQQSVTAYEALGAEMMRPHCLALLAEAYGAAGQEEQGLVVVTDALAKTEMTGGRYYEAELWRLKGELTLQAKASARQVQPKGRTNREKSKLKGSSSRFTAARPVNLEPNAADAEACFRKAIEIARSQSARSLELRAVMSLSRLWRESGKRKEARKLLADIYRWFSEGFDTPDLREAKALLSELRG